MQTGYTADKIFTGLDWLPDHAIIIEENRIVEVLPAVSLSQSLRAEHFSLIAPAFIDLQIYGAMERLLSAYPSAESLRLLQAHCREGGTHRFLPTVATNTTEVFHACIDAVRKYWAEDGKGVEGLHIEGPWINPVKRGAHIEGLVRQPVLEEVRELLSYGHDVIRMITLAPEVCSQEIINTIAAEGIIVSAGHSNATFKEGMNAFDNGVEAATHLFNAMSPLHHREPGLAAAVLQHPLAMASIIPDGLHVDFEMINMAWNLMGERLFIITDAVTGTDKGAYPHVPAGEGAEARYEAGGILSGSALTMARGVKNLVEKARIPLSAALQMASLIPARLLGVGHRCGMIKKGYDADLVFLDNALNVI